MRNRLYIKIKLAFIKCACYTMHIVTSNDIQLHGSSINIVYSKYSVGG